MPDSIHTFSPSSQPHAAGSIVDAVSDSANEHLAWQKHFQTNLLNSFPFAVWLKKANGQYFAINQAFTEVFGITQAQIDAGKTVFDFFPQETAQRFTDEDNGVIANRQPIHVHERLITVDGTHKWIETWKACLELNGQAVGTIGFSSNIEDRMQAQSRLDNALWLMESLLQGIPDPIWMKDAQGRFAYCNNNACRLLGMSAAEIIGKTQAEIAQVSPLEGAAQLTEHAEQATVQEIWIIPPGSQGRMLLEVRSIPLHTPEGQVSGFLGIARDITELTINRQRLQRIAYYDDLTGLPNRALCLERLSQSIQSAVQSGKPMGLLMLDLDHFKEVNDSLGHARGDDLLREVALRLSQSTGPKDTVARLGGDEFALILPELGTMDRLEWFATTILSKFERPIVLDGRDYFVTCSIGITVCPRDSKEPSDLLKFADSAMYLAKRSGRNAYRFYSSDLTASAERRLSIENELHQAVTRGDLQLYFQPKISLSSGRMIGSEALIRWMHPLRGMIGPNEFIPIAESSGLIVEIGDWVMHQACRFAASFNHNQPHIHKVSINLSPRQFQNNQLVKKLEAALHDNRCRAEWIEVEITESILMEQDHALLETLHAIEAMGITIAIDDFGTGYSSLSYLSTFPIHTLKIDRSFIQNLTTNHSRLGLVRGILSIANALNQNVVAEGVETEDQAAWLATNGCQVAQGYLYSKPVPETQMWALPLTHPLPQASDAGSQTMFAAARAPIQ